MGACHVMARRHVARQSARCTQDGRTTYTLNYIPQDVLQSVVDEGARLGANPRMMTLRQIAHAICGRRQV